MPAARLDTHVHSPFTPKQILTYLLCLLLALLLHSGIYHVLHDHRAVEASGNAVRLRVVSSPIARRAPAHTKARARSAATISSPQESSAQIIPVPKYPDGKAGYQKLLPPQSRDYGDGNRVNPSDGPAMLGEKLSPTMQSHLAIMASEFDIPLHWRKFANSSLAVANLAVREDGEVWCRLLTGEPLLRAVLWKYLQKPSVYAALVELLHNSQLKDYQIRLRFIPESGPERELNFSEGSAAYVRGVEIIKTLPSPVTDFGGVEISNADSRKAKLKDRLALGDLYESPAFIHQIREVKLGRL